MRKLQLRHEIFARSLATRLSIHLRLEIGARVLELEPFFFHQLLDVLPPRTQLTIFRMEEAEGMGLVDVPPNLAMALVDRLTGGTGKTAALERDMSEIETALLDQIVELTLKEWNQTVPELTDVRPKILGHETNPHFLSIAPADASVLVLALEIRLQDVTEQVHLAWPSAMLQPLLRQFGSSPGEQTSASGRPGTPPRWNPELNCVRIPLSIEWEGLEINARRLAHLQVGDVLQIAPDRINHTSVRLAKVPKFTGRLGRCGKTWAVELLAEL